MRKVVVHRIVLKVLDFEGADPHEVARAIANHRHFPASVMSHIVAEDEWTGDDHLMNKHISDSVFDEWMWEHGAKEVGDE